MSPNRLGYQVRPVDPTEFEDTPTITSARIRLLRKHLGLSIPQFAAVVGTSKRNAYRWENEESPVRHHRLVRVLSAMMEEYLDAP